MELGYENWFNVTVEKVSLSHKCVIRRMSLERRLPLYLSSEGWCEGQCLIITVRNGKQKVTESLRTSIRGWEEIKTPEPRGQKSKKRELKKELERRHILMSFEEYIFYYLLKKKHTKQFGIILRTLCIWSYNFRTLW